MSTYLAVHIEYRKDGKWNLLTTLGPHFPHKLSEYVDGVWRDVEDNPDVIINNVGYDYHNCEYFGGSARDFFKDNLIDSDIIDRGFPPDMSKELSDYIDNETKKLNIGLGKWYSDTSYFTLNELDSVYDKMLNDFNSRYTKSISATERQKFDSSIKEKLNKILRHIGENIIDKPTEEYETDPEEWLIDDFWDANQMYGLYVHLNDTVKHYLDIYRDEDVRIVVYIC